MILLFLRLFPQFSLLEASLRESANGRIAAEDRERVWRSRCESAEALRDKALEERERNHKMVCNWMAIYQGSPSVPYPEVYVSPPVRDEAGSDATPRKRHASEVARELDREFREQFGAQANQDFDRFSQ